PPRARSLVGGVLGAERERLGDLVLLVRRVRLGVAGPRGQEAGGDEHRAQDDRDGAGIGDPHRRQEGGGRHRAHLRRPADGEALIEWRAECGTRGDTPRAASQVAWYCEAKMLPRTATPSAPPVWRVVSFTADPTPARPGGSDPMIDSVTGDTVIPIPMPYTS